MPTAPAVTVLVLSLFGGAEGQRSQLPECAVLAPPLELKAEPIRGQVHRVCLSPGLPTTLVFDSPLPPGAVKWKEGQRERFTDVLVGALGFTFIPLEDFGTGEVLPVEVHFEDGAAPESVTVEFIGHPGRAPREVAVYRHARTLKSYQEEARREREHSQRLQLQLAQVLAQDRGHTDLLELLAGRRMPSPRRGVPVLPLLGVIQSPSSSALLPKDASGYSFTTRHEEKGEEVVQVVLELLLKNPGTEPWLAGPEAVLVGAGKFVKEAKVRQPTPIPPGEEAVVYVAAELTVAEARGVFVLRMWDETGARRVTLERVGFP